MAPHQHRATTYAQQPEDLAIRNRQIDVIHHSEAAELARQFARPDCESLRCRGRAHVCGECPGAMRLVPERPASAAPRDVNDPTCHPRSHEPMCGSLRATGGVEELGYPRMMGAITAPSAGIANSCFMSGRFST